METVEEKKAGFKKTKLGWIPEDWSIKSVDFVFDFLKTNSLSRNQLSNESLDENSIFNIHYGDIHSSFKYELLDVSKEATLPKIIDNGLIKSEPDYLKDGDLVMADASEDYEGICDCVELKNVNNIKLVSGLHTFALRDKGNYFIDGFKPYLFKNQNVVKSICRVATGISVLGVSKSNLGKILISIPPLPEQKKIAAILSTWDTAISETQKLIEQLQLRKKALMQQLLTGKTRLSGFSGEWEEVRLGDIVDFKNGKGHEKVITKEGKYIVVNSKFISTNGLKRKYTNKQLSPLFKNDIALVMSDIPNGKALAKTYLVEEDNLFTLNQRICSLTPYKNYSSLFLYYLLNRNHYFMRFNDGAKQTNLRKNEVLSCPLTIPSLSEQKAIASVIETADQEISLQQEYLEQLQSQKKGLMQQLLTGRIRVKL